uniref:C-type lectin domain-containing protein n=1 Tax=Acrobeloides nanus TaxID=290746 RepID=A0A914CKE7_9BILA
MFDYQRFWLNANITQSNYVWHDGQKMIYQNWAVQQPLINNPNKTCVQIKYGSGKWYIGDCAQSLPRIICMFSRNYCANVTSGTNIGSCNGNVCLSGAKCINGNCICP